MKTIFANPIFELNSYYKVYKSWRDLGKNVTSNMGIKGKKKKTHKKKIHCTVLRVYYVLFFNQTGTHYAG
jgi:hypothetical protein